MKLMEEKSSRHRLRSSTTNSTYPGTLSSSPTLLRRRNTSIYGISLAGRMWKTTVDKLRRAITWDAEIHGRPTHIQIQTKRLCDAIHRDAPNQGPPARIALEQSKQ